MAITAQTARKTRNDMDARFGSAVCTTGTTIYAGSLVMLTAATGLALPGADTAGCVFVGICTKTVTSAAAGALVYFKYNHEELFTCASTLAAVVTAAAVIADNDELTTVAIGTNDVKVGAVTQYVSATKAWVHVRSAATS